MLADAWKTRSEAPRSSEDERDARPVVKRVEPRHAIGLHESLAIAECLHVAILSVAGRRFGTDAIPSVLSGRGADGRPLSTPEQHLHKHILVGADDTALITRLAIWAPGGFTRAEREVVTGARLRWRGRFVTLASEHDGEHPAFATARSWQSFTPYLPFNHVKSRGRNSVEGQIRRELVEFRALGEPATVTARPWARGRFGLSRAGRWRGGPPPTPLEVRITFAEPVPGPIALGRHAHFSLGLMLPADDM